MSDAFVPLAPARLDYDADGTLVSQAYGDVYHSRSGALAQAAHVFLGGNDLPQRWRGSDRFTVCETGFGTGTNFLALWRAWRDDAARCGRLHVIAFEAHPFTAHDMAVLAQRSDPGIRPLALALAHAWPALLPGIHRLVLDQGAVTLTLVFGPIERTARQVQARVDAFFLDGFAPDRNPAMWSRALFGQLARLAGPHATAATWCSAVAVRKALGDAGFVVAKAPGFGRKREMSIARLRDSLTQARLVAPAPAPDAGPIAIIGAGLAGAAIAHALSRRGKDCVVFDPAFADGGAAAHQGHAAAALSPVLSGDDDLRARLCRAGLQGAVRDWSALAQPDARPLRCGTLEVGLTEHEREAQRRAVRRLAFPDAWVRWLDREAASDHAGLSLPHGGLFFAQGCLVRPPRLIPALLSGAIRRQEAVAALQRTDAGAWILKAASGETLLQAQTVILANAAGAHGLLAAAVAATAAPRLASAQRTAGQVSLLRPDAHCPAPAVILAGNGYWLPEDAGYSVGGSTYRADAVASIVEADGHAAILEKLQVLSGARAALLRERLAANPSGWAGWRLAMADHLPVIGPVADASGLWVAAAFGSRGLAWGALAGEIIAATLAGEPVALERELLRRILPR